MHKRTVPLLASSLHLLSLEPAQNLSESNTFVSQVENASWFVLRVLQTFGGNSAICEEQDVP